MSENRIYSKKNRKADIWSLEQRHVPSEGIAAHALLKYLNKNNLISDENVDVYNLIYVGTYYDLYRFEIVDAGLDGQQYAIGDESDLDSSVKTYLNDLIDDVGYKFVKDSFLKDYIDKQSIINYIKEYIINDVYQNPDVYLEDSNRDLSDEQRRDLKFYNYKIEKINSDIEKLKENLMDGNKSFFTIQINQYNEIIDDLFEKIKNIQENPSGDFSERAIEQKIDEEYDDAKKNPTYYLDSMIGIDWRDSNYNFINNDDLISGVIKNDGYGIISGYDGEINEIYFQKELFYLFRVE